MRIPAPMDDVNVQMPDGARLDFEVAIRGLLPELKAYATTLLGEVSRAVGLGVPWPRSAPVSGPWFPEDVLVCIGPCKEGVSFDGSRGDAQY